MLDLRSALRRKEGGGAPLPDVWSEQKEFRAHVRRGQYTLIAGHPGVGKSVIADNIALRCGGSALIFSADTDPATRTARIMAAITGTDIADIDTAMQAGTFLDSYDTDLRQLAQRGIRFVFDSNPSLDDLTKDTFAYGGVFGSWPDLIVVDNLANLAIASDSEGDRLNKASVFLHSMAWMTGSAMVALHHLDSSVKSNEPPPLQALRYKIDREPEMVWTLFARMDHELCVCVVKNRWGRANPNPIHATFRLRTDFAHGLIESR
jgi:replicative DNA helicase